MNRKQDTVNETVMEYADMVTRITKHRFKI